MDEIAPVPVLDQDDITPTAMEGVTTVDEATPSVTAAKATDTDKLADSVVCSLMQYNLYK